MSMRLVLIEWVDAYGCSTEWRELGDIEASPMICRSVGWLVHDGDDSKVIVPHLADSVSQGCGDMTIPATAIRSMCDIGPDYRQEVIDE